MIGNIEGGGIVGKEGEFKPNDDLEERAWMEVMIQIVENRATVEEAE